MAGKGSDHVPTSQGYPRGGRSEIDRDPEGQSRDMTCLACISSLPYCRYADIVLQEDKIVSNSLIDLQDMCVKAFIHIELACKPPPPPPGLPFKLNKPYTKLRVAFFFSA